MKVKNKFRFLKRGSALKPLYSTLQFISISLLFVLALSAQAADVLAPQGLVLQGRLVRPDGSAVDATNVDFVLQVRSPGAENCVLFEETHTLNMAASDGVFSIRVGSGTRSGTNFKDTSTLKQVFNNNQSPISSLTCASGSSYTPTSADARKLHISFDEGSGVQSLAQDQLVGAVPYALLADTLQGKSPSDFLSTITALEGTPGTTQTRVVRVFNTDYAVLDALLNGTSTLYSKGVPTAAVDYNNQRIINVADPTGAQDAATKNYTDTKIGAKTLDLTGVGSGTGDGKVLTWDATNNKWVVSTPTTTDATKLPLAGGTMAGDINMAGYNILVAGHVQLGLQKTLLLGRYTTAEETTLIGTLVAADAGRVWYNTTTGKQRYWNGTAAADVSSTNIGTSAGQAMGADAVPHCTSLQKLEMSLGPTYSWSCVSDSSQWVTNGSDIGYSAGSVGIGTTSPSSPLHVVANVADGRNYFDTYGNGGSPIPGFITRAARGTSTAPSALANGDSIGYWAGRGYGATAMASGSRATIGMFAGEAWTDSAQGTFINFSTTPLGSTTSAERMRIDSAGNVGIGTTVPGYKLDVAGAINATSLKINGVDVATGAQATQWTTTGSDVYYNTGKVGIGTSAPSTTAHIRSTAVGTVLRVEDSTAHKQNFSGRTIEHSYNNEANPRSAFGDAATGTSGRDGLIFNPLTTSAAAATGSGLDSPASRTLAFYTSNATALTERMRIDSGGNVGIGTTAPGYKLDVNGAINATAVKINGVDVATSGGAGGGQSSTSSLTYNSNSDSTGTDGGFNFQSAGVSLFSITDGGDAFVTKTLQANQLIGGESTQNTYVPSSGSTYIPTAPYAAQFINGNANNSNSSLVLTKVRNASSTYQYGYYGFISNASINAPTFVLGRSTGGNSYSESLRVDSNGYIGIGVTAPTAPLQVSTAQTAASGVAKGAYFNQTLTAAANNDVLIGLDVQPTFTNGAYTSVTNTAARFKGAVNLGNYAAVNNGRSSLGLNVSTTVDNSATAVTAASGTTVHLENSDGTVGSYTNLAFRTDAAGTGVWSNLSLTKAGSGAGIFKLHQQGVQQSAVYSGTGDMVLQNGGTFTDAGFGLDAQNASTAGYFRAGANALVVNTSNNVGIGTTAPAYKLDVNGAVNATALKINGVDVATSGGAGGGQTSTTALTYNSNSDSTGTDGGFNFQAGGANLLTISNAGVVNVPATTASTSSGTGALTVAGGIGAAGNINAGGSITATTSGYMPQIYGSTASAGDIKIDGTDHATKGNVLLATAGGKVGIGTTAPSNILSLGGTANRTIAIERNPTASTAGRDLTVSAGGAASGGNDLLGGNLILSSGTSTGAGYSGIQFQTATAAGTGTADNAPTTKMTITSTGRVGIGSTAPTHVMDIYSGAAYNSYFKFFDNTAARVSGFYSTTESNPRVGFGQYQSASGTMGLIFSQGTGTAAATGAMIDSPATRTLAFYTSNGTTGIEQMRISPTGNVGIGTTTPTAALTLKAGAAAAGSAPLKLTAGTNLTTPEEGAIEFDGTNLYFTDNTPARRTIATTSSGSFSGVSSIANATGNITLAPQTSSGYVSITSGTPATGSTSGALVVSGGAGVSGSLYTGGSVNAGTSLTVGTLGYIPQLYGTTSASGNIKIDGTSDASKGYVLLNSAGGNVGIGTTAPASVLHSVATDANAGTINWTNFTNVAKTTTALNQASVTSTTAFAAGSTVANMETFTINPSAAAASVFAGRQQVVVIPATSTNTVSSVSGLNQQLSNLGSGAVGGIIGASFGAYHGGTGTVTEIDGISLSAVVPNVSAQTSTTTKLVGAAVKATNASTNATVTGAYGVEIIGSNTGTMTDAYGLHISGMSSGTHTNTAYDIYAADTAAYNYFGGKVGIGTTAPAQSLDVVGSINASSGVTAGQLNSTGSSGSAAGNLLLTNKVDTGASAIQFYGNSSVQKGSISMSYSSSNTDSYIAFSTRNSATVAERVRIINNGSVGIGTTAPTQALEVNGSILASAYLYSSDRRLKTDFQPLDGSLEKLLTLNTVKFRWITPKNEDENRVQIGLIAQDVQKVYPEAVTVDKDGWLRLNYFALISPVIDGMRELYHKVTAVDQRTQKLEKQVADLQEQNKRLEERLNKIEAMAPKRQPASK